MSYFQCKPLASGELDKYFTIIKKLGSGGFGDVYLASTLPAAKVKIGRDLPDTVAIKEVSILRERDKELLLNELNIMKSLNLPHSIRYYGCFESHDGRLFMIISVAEGKELFDYINEQTLTLKQKNIIAYELALAIQEFHDAGLAHRDLKPENVMVNISSDGSISIKIIDYGFACALSDIDSYACTKKHGSVAYYDYKQQLGNFESMKKADWWAFGHILVVMYLRKLLFMEALVAHRKLTAAELAVIPQFTAKLLENLTSARLSQNERPKAEEIIKTVRLTAYGEQQGQQQQGQSKDVFHTPVTSFSQMPNPPTSQ